MFRRSSAPKTRRLAILLMLVWLVVTASLMFSAIGLTSKWYFVLAVFLTVFWPYLLLPVLVLRMRSHKKRQQAMAAAEPVELPST